MPDPNSFDDDAETPPLSRHSLRARFARRRQAQGCTSLVLGLQSGYRLDRALSKRLLHRSGSGASMRPIIHHAIAELLAMGLTDVAILSLLAELVEQTASALGLQKRSVLTGQPDWVSTQLEVMTLARLELRA